MEVGCGGYVKTGLVQKGLNVADRPWQCKCMKPFSQGVVQRACEPRCRVALSTDCQKKSHHISKCTFTIFGGL